MDENEQQKSKQANNNNQNPLKCLSNIVLALRERIKEALNIVTIVYVNTNS